MRGSRCGGCLFLLLGRRRSLPCFRCVLSHGCVLPIFPVRSVHCKVPVQARSRSDKYAAVLRLHRTQPKDRRIYTALTGILAERQAAWERPERARGTGKTAQGSRVQLPAKLFGFSHFKSGFMLDIFMSIF